MTGDLLAHFWSIVCALHSLRVACGNACGDPACGERYLEPILMRTFFINLAWFFLFALFLKRHFIVALVARLLQWQHNSPCLEQKCRHFPVGSSKVHPRTFISSDSITVLHRKTERLALYEQLPSYRTDKKGFPASSYFPQLLGFIAKRLSPLWKRLVTKSQAFLF